MFLLPNKPDLSPQSCGADTPSSIAFLPGRSTAVSISGQTVK